MNNKNIFLVIFGLLIATGIAFGVNNLPFYQAVKTCESYSNIGDGSYDNETFKIEITLQKSKNNHCIYKEKISQGPKYQLLTCDFLPYQLEYISNSMQRYNKYFSKQIPSGSIFEAKLTSNAEVFNKYVADPKNCKVTYSKNSKR